MRQSVAAERVKNDRVQPGLFIDVSTTGFADPFPYPVAVRSHYAKSLMSHRRLTEKLKEEFCKDIRDHEGERRNEAVLDGTRCYNL